MDWIGELFRRLSILFRRGQLHRDLEEEMQFHLAMQAEAARQEGLSPEEAPQRARRQFGNAALLKEKGVEVWGWGPLERLAQDFRHAFRALRKDAALSAVAALTMALGIGANTAVFSVVSAVLLRPLPFKDPGRLVMLWATWPRFEMDGSGSKEVVVSPSDFHAWQEQSQSIGRMAAIQGSGGSIAIAGEPTSIQSSAVSSAFFDVLGVYPAIGRAFTPEDQRGEGAQVVILGDGLWRKLGGDRGLVGKTVRLYGATYTVAGVMPRRFNFPNNAEAWIPIADSQREPDSGSLRIIAKLRPGVSVAQAQSEMDVIAARLRQKRPERNGRFGIGVNVAPLQQQIVGDAGRALYVLLGAVACVLLIACANIANLLLARATTRRREFALRLALGASRGRVIRNVMAESVLLSLAGGAIGALWAWWGVQAFVALDPIKIPRVQEIAVNPAVLIFTLAVAVATGLLFGLAPALHVSKQDLNNMLKDGSERSAGRPSRNRARSVLAAAQIALSIVLLTGAGLLLRSFIARVTVPLGFRPEGLAAAELPNYVNRRIDTLLDRLAGLPGVQSVGAGTAFPNEPAGSSGGFEIENRPSQPDEEFRAGYIVVTPGYFRAAGMRIRRGRLLSADDAADAMPVAVVNEALARRYFRNEDPLGRRIRRGDGPWSPIVGIAENVKGFGVEGDPQPAIYFSNRQAHWSNDVFVLVRTAVPPAAMTGAIRKEIRAWNKNVLIDKLAPIEDLLSESVTVPRFYMLLVTAFAALALTLGVVGVYGVLNYSVAQRAHEIGVRMALGAERIDVLHMVLTQGLTVILAGMAIGLAGAWASTRALATLLFGVKPGDAFSFAGACFVLLAAGLLACYIPARRAARVDPVAALRE